MTKEMLPEGTLEGQTAVITGGGSGMGFGIAQELSRLGAQVVLVGRKQEKLDAAVADIEKAGGQAFGVPTDIRNPEQVDTLMDTVVERTGRLDILVNGAAGLFMQDSDQMSIKGWDSVVGTVLNGSFYCSRAAGIKMIELGNGGRILSIVASYAWTGGPKTVHSVSAKAGVIAMTKTLGAEWAKHGIRVNAISPGVTNTEAVRPIIEDEKAGPKMKAKIPNGRFGEVKEMAQAASYLVSPFADFVNGEVLVIDGGEWLGKGLV